MDAVDCHQHQQFFTHLEQSEGLPPGSIEIVESVADWCDEHGILDDNPGRLAVSVRERESGAPHIAIKREISEEEMRSVLSYMLVSGYGDVAEQVQDGTTFLRLLAYHELAHLVLNDPTEEQCDRWALIKVKAEPSATDNPDDAQRLREHH